MAQSFYEDTCGAGANPISEDWRSKHRREKRNIGARSKTSAREAKHRREKQNIGARSKTSAREAKHRREKQNINNENNNPSAKSLTEPQQCSGYHTPSGCVIKRILTILIRDISI